jgi:hypothetical protein
MEKSLATPIPPLHPTAPPLEVKEGIAFSPFLIVRERRKMGLIVK